MNNKKLYTFEDELDVFMSDIDRIKYVSRNYKNLPIAKSFAIYYNEEISEQTKADFNVNTIHTINVGQYYLGIVDEVDYDKNRIYFTLPGVKYKIVCKDYPAAAFANLSNYLLVNDNKMFFEVREFDRPNMTFYVSVL